MKRTALAILVVVTLVGCLPRPIPLPVSPTPVFTPVPWADLPPQVMSHIPPQGAEHPATAPILLHFDQPMDRAATQSAFSLTPFVTGRMDWPDPTTLRFTPDSPLEPDTLYRAAITSTARSVTGLKIAAPVSFRFSAPTPLSVTQVSPVPGATSVLPTTDLLVTFNRPVIPLTLDALRNQSAFPQPVTLDPPAAGQGEWINTSTYVFHPEGLEGGVTYTARIPVSLADLAGVPMQREYAWRFSTLSPAVLQTQPLSGAVGVPPDAVIRVTFNQPMEAAAGDVVRLAGPQGDVPGVVTRVSTTTLTFTPTVPLVRAAFYTATVAGGLRNLAGSATSAPYQWTFSSLEHFRVVKTDPADGAVGVQLGDSAERGYKGQFSINFSAPVAQAEVRKHLRIAPPPSEAFRDLVNDGPWAMVSFLQPGTAYTVTIDGALTDRYGEALGQDVTLHFSTAQLPPVVYLNTDHPIGLMRADDTPLIYAGHRDVPQLDLAFYRLGPGEILSDTGVFSLKWNQLPAWGVPTSGAPRLPDRSWSMPVSRSPEITVTPVTLTENGGPLPPGVYRLFINERSANEARERNCKPNWLPSCAMPRQQTIVVATGHILLQRGLHQTLAWATDLHTSAPLANQTIWVPLGNKSFKTTTDADGIAVLPANTEWAFIIQGDTFAVGYAGWQNSPWVHSLSMGYPRFYSNGYMGPDAQAIYLYTDRPLYRPGDTVYFKGIVRKENGIGRYDLTFPKALTITLDNSQGQQVYEQSLPLNDIGAFSGTFTLEPYAPLGGYLIRTCNKPCEECYIDCSRVSFRVAAYRPPEFQVTVAPDHERYFAGDNARILVEARTYFGAVVPGAQVNWQRTGAMDEILGQGSGSTDANGRFGFSLKLDKAGESRLVARVLDAAGQTVAGESALYVFPADLQLQIKPASWFAAADQPVQVAVQAAGLDKTPRAEAEITLVAFRWTRSGQPAILTTTLTTNADGWAVTDMTLPGGGQYRLEATASDSAGRPAKATNSLWITGRAALWPTDSVALVTDRDAYAPGETARLLIPNPWPSEAVVLITVERGDVLEHRVVTVPAGGSVIEWPITPFHAPNIYFGVVLLPTEASGRPNPAILLGSKEIQVSLAERKLNLEITAQPSQAQPGEVVTWTVRATDWKGAPAQAELSLAVVDQAVLALADPNSPNPSDAFYARRDRNVTAIAGLHFPAAHPGLLTPNFYSPMGKGGGGGGEPPLGEAGAAARQDFRGTALWSPALRTDANGIVRIRAALPDNITTWQMDARAVDADTRVGQSTVTLTATKPLLVRPVTPRFFVMGDRLEVSGIVHNNTDRAMTTTIVLSATSVTLSAPPTQTLSIAARGEAQATWPIVVEQGESADLVFIVAAQHPSLGWLTDASRPPAGLPPDQHLPVYHYTTPETVGTAGQLASEGERTEGILLPADLDATQGELTLRAETSLAATVVNTLRANDAPYRSFPTAEMVVSRLLPNLFTYRAIREAGLSTFPNASELSRKLRPLIHEDLYYLALLQHGDGGWGWVWSDASTPVMSAQVLVALVNAQRQDFSVNPDQIKRAIVFLQHQVQPPDKVEQLNHQAIVLHALTEAGVGDVSALQALATRRQRLAFYARGLLLLSFARIAPADAAVASLLSDVTAAAKLSATGAHWEEEGAPDYWAMNTDNRTSAIVLDALVNLSPESDLVSNAVRWLKVARQADGKWETSQETMWCLMALSDWLTKSGELHPDYAWKVSLNNRLLIQDQATDSKAFEPTVLRIAVASLLHDTANRLTVERGAGPGRLYYTAHLRAFRPVEAVPPINQGIFVAREYTLASSDRPITSARAGDLIQVRLTIVAPNDLHYVVIEDPLPAGCEAVDPALRTAASLWQTPLAARNYQWRWWFNQVDLRDEKAVLMATTLPRGVYEFRYFIQATRPGEYRVLPVTANESFFPEIFGHGAGTLFKVDRE